jgi:hypothetical protein
VDEQKKQTIFDAPKVIAIGIASPAATLLTSRFGIAGTLMGGDDIATHHAHHGDGVKVIAPPP